MQRPLLGPAHSDVAVQCQGLSEVDPMASLGASSEERGLKGGPKGDNVLIQISRCTKVHYSHGGSPGMSTIIITLVK